MSKFGRFLIASSLVLAGITAASAASPTGGALRSAPPGGGLEPAQYLSCSGWRQECANLYGWRTHNWQVCMGQAAAVAACRGGGYRGPRNYDGGGNLSCGEWRQACANLYGWRTRDWHVCMGQGAAIAACRR